MTASFRIEPVRLVALDAELWALGPLRIVRRDAELWLECEDASVAPLVVRALARAGARATGDAGSAPVAHGAIAALAPHLEPIHARGVVDVVSLRPLSIGEATLRLVRHDRFGRRRRDADSIRAVLRDADRAFLWRRVVWAMPRDLRSRGLGRLRPVVFDHGAVHRAADALALVSADALTRWAR